MKQELIDVADLVTNDGQIPGLPRNPRWISDADFAKLKRSIEDFPEMLEIREVIAFPFNGKFVIIAGNMRYQACKELGHKQIAAKILPATFPVDKLKELTIKDNSNFGQYDFDIIANEFSSSPLDDWGLSMPDLDEFKPNLAPEFSTKKVSAEDIVKTEEELNTHYKDTKQNYVEVICPHCAETFYLNP